MLKWLKSNTGQTSIALWFAYFFGLVLFHKIKPSDSWDRVTFHPAFLILMPLLAAAIPWLQTKPASEPEDPRRDTLRSMAIYWIFSVVVFSFPLSRRREQWAFLVHNPVFLAVAPLLIACIAFIRPLPISIRTAAPPPAHETLTRKQVSSGIVACIAAMLLFGGVFWLINTPSLNTNHMPVLWPDIFITACIVGFLLRVRYLLLRRETRDYDAL